MIGKLETCFSSGSNITVHNILQITMDEWQPDYGSTQFIPSWGATVAGARKFLIAYNINVLGTKEQAHRVALNLRENGRGKDKVSVWYLPPNLLIFIQPGENRKVFIAI